RAARELFEACGLKMMWERAHQAPVAHGLVHGDLKPLNIMRTDGRLVVIDWAESYGLRPQPFEGAFDDGYDAYGWEDLDLGRRLRKAGFTRLEAKDAVAYHVDPPITTQTQLQARLAKERERGRTALRFLENHREFSARLTAQDTAFHALLNWLMRFGGVIREDNVLAWAEWARRRGWTGLERVWLAGVINHAYLSALAASKKGRREAQRGDGR